jgi:phage gp36-like protein
MAAYCTAADMLARYGETELTQLTDRDGSECALVMAVLETAITDACSDIDGYLSDGGYALPLAQAPHVLVRHACVIARAYLYDDVRPKDVLDDYNRTIAWLEKIADGRLRLPATDAGGEIAAGSVSTGARLITYTDDLWSTYSPTI